MVVRQTESIPIACSRRPGAAIAADVGDAELLARFTTDRDEPAETAFAALVRRHGPMVFRLCRQILVDQHTAEDAFQATFLILARRAGSIQQPELLGHWLHGVATRTAREARMREYRRQRRECAITGEHSVAERVDQARRPDLSLICREEFEALHEEVLRLPEKYRVPVVLCDLEGLTYQDAADRLGCPVATVGVRLRRARERLRARMTRRGLAPTAALLGTLLAPEAASACSPPPVLIDSTVKAAMSFSAGTTAAATVGTAAVVALSERVLRAMALSRFKTTAHFALAAGIAILAAWLAMPHRTKVAVVLPSTDAQTAQQRVPSYEARESDAASSASANDTSAQEAAAPAEATVTRAPEPCASKGASALPDDVFAHVAGDEDPIGKSVAVAAFEPGRGAWANHEEFLARNERARARSSLPRTGYRTIRAATAAMAWGRCTTTPRASPAMAWGRPAVRGLRARTWC